MDELTLAEEGACDIFLLNFIDECQSVIAETLRLLDFLPNDVVDPSKSRFKPILLDFMYFSKTDYYEKELAKHENLQTEFYNQNGDVLSRFEILFQAVGNLLTSFVEYTKQVTPDSDSSSLDYTRELEVEALAKVGMIVYYFNRLLDGGTRERLYIAIYRNSDERRNIDFLVDFLRQEISPFDNIILGEYMYNRVRIDQSFVENCLYFFEAVNRRKKENNLKRISNNLQEALFCCLLFSHKVRYGEHARMKFFVENYFRDNWVISLGLGINVSVGDEWFDCPAANNALHRHFTNEKIKEMAKEQFHIISDTSVFTKDIKPEKFELYIDTIQRYNSAYQWMVLHTDKTMERLGRDYTQQICVAAKFQEKALDVILRLASFESQVRKAYSLYIRQRQSSLGSIREEVCNIIHEVAELFNTGFQAIKLEKREKLYKWLILIKDTLEKLDLENHENSMLVQQIRRRFIQVGEVLDLGENLAMAHFLEKVKKNLDSLSAGLATTEGGEDRLFKAADSPYMWSLIDKWLAKIQEKILKSTRSQLVQILFFKLSLSITSISNTLQTETRKDLIGRAYSCYLERRLRNVLQSIPNHLFKVLHEKVVPQVKQEWAATIDKTMVREMADFTENFKLSEVTYSISNMSIGISRLSITKLGTIDINPKELLEEGIRRELRVEFPNLLSLSEKEQKEKNLSLDIILSRLTNNLSNFKRAFIYMCEHVGVNGYELWREEMSNYMETTEQYLTMALPKKPSGPLPAFTIIYNYIIKQTDPMQTSYSENDMVWRDRKNLECFSIRYSDMIEKWIPIHSIKVFVDKLVKETEDSLIALAKSARSYSTTVGGFLIESPIVLSKKYESLMKLIMADVELPCLVAKIGQYVLLQSILIQSKREHARLRATQLFSALEASNRFMFSDLSNLCSEVRIVSLLSKITGIVLPRLNLYSSPSFPSHTGFLISCVLIANSHRFNNLKKDSICEYSFLSGCSTILHHTDDFQLFASAISELVIYSNTGKKLPLKLIINKEKLEHCTEIVEESI